MFRFRFSRLHPPKKNHVCNLKKQISSFRLLNLLPNGLGEPSTLVEQLRSNQAAIFTPVFAPRVLHQPVLVCTLPASVKVRKGGVREKHIFFQKERVDDSTGDEGSIWKILVAT